MLGNVYWRRGISQSLTPTNIKRNRIEAVQGTMANGSRPIPGSYTSSPASANARRLSYASVASGAAGQSYASPARAGAFSHLTGTTPNNSYPPQYQQDYRIPRPQSGQDSETNPNGSVPFGSTWRKPTPLPSYSRQFAHIPPYGPPMPPNSFFYPSYLRSSRYVAKLEAAHKAKLATRRESMSTHSSNPASLSTSATHANVQRIAPSHRGMTYEIVESNPPKDDSDLMPLPSRWSETEKNQGLDLLADGLELRYNGASGKVEHEAAAARADYPMSPQCGIYYYEVEIKSKTKEGMIAIGFSTQKASLERLPGWESESWAYHGDDGKTFFGEATGIRYGPTFTVGDVIGCGINFNTGQAFFTKNGVDLGCAFRDIRTTKPFPSVGMKKHTGASISVNFGRRPFLFDIDAMMAREQDFVLRDIMQAKVAGPKDKPFAEAEQVQQLVAHFLAHDGYVETARAFMEEVQAEKRALNIGKDEKIEPIPIEDDFDATNRQS